MTPSEIAGWLDDEAETRSVGFVAARLYEAAATIRRLELSETQWIVVAQTATDNRILSETKLKIATEALEGLPESVLADFGVTQALARIKEVW